MGDQSSDTKPYDGTFKTLMRFCTELLVALVNYAFGKRFGLGEAVTFLQSEVYATDGDGERHPRTADSVFRLADFTYHMECQSYGDSTIEVRLVETGFGTAIRERKIQPGLIETEYPRQAVLYLTCPKNTPDAVTMRLKLPNGETSEWSIPAIKLSALGLDEIFALDLYFLLPFCLFWYGREGLKKCNSNESRLAEMCAMLDDIRDRLLKAMEAGRISDFNMSMVLDAMNYVSRKLSDGYKNVMKAVNEKMGEEFIEFPTLKKLREARLQGKAEGVAEGEALGKKLGFLDALFGLVRKKRLSIADASSEAGMSEADFVALMEEQVRASA